MAISRLSELGKKYPNKSKRETVLKSYSNASIDRMIKNAGTQQEKIYLSSFKK